MTHNNLEQLKTIDINKEDILNFIDITTKAITSEELNEKISLIEQLEGHIKQLLARINDFLKKEKLDKLTTYLKETNEKLITIKNQGVTNIKIDSLLEIYQDLLTSYNELVTEVISKINSNNISEYNNLIEKANEKINKLNTLDFISEQAQEEIIKIYTDITNNHDPLNNLHTLIATIDEVLTKPNSDLSKGSFINRNFSLFAKINDQIIESLYSKQNDLVYAKYTLEDNSTYYAIIRSEEEINTLDQSFTNLPNLILTKDKIIESCKIIINNAGIYYNLNEYMRYIEKSYKTNMTKEIDELILKYKKRLQGLEDTIKKQLIFIDKIALLVNNKPCPDYPNITYTDIPVVEYFKDIKKTDSKEEEVAYLITNVLLNDKVTSSFDTIEILKTLYSADTLTSLITSDYNKTTKKPSINTTDNIIKEIPTKEITTNYEKIDNYLSLRVTELNLLKSKDKINVTITKDSNPLFKDINTILDVNTAIAICDKVYKKGQGIYALSDYLKTGNTLKFTSKYKARELVSTTNKNEYLKLWFENIIKNYIYLKDKNITNNLTEFLEKNLQKNISYQEIIANILDNPLVVTMTITDFVYNFLNPNSKESKQVEALLNNSDNPTIAKLNLLLKDLK